MGDVATQGRLRLLLRAKPSTFESPGGAAEGTLASCTLWRHVIYCLWSTCVCLRLGGYLESRLYLLWKEVVRGSWRLLDRCTDPSFLRAVVMLGPGRSTWHLWLRSPAHRAECSVPTMSLGQADRRSAAVGLPAWARWRCEVRMVVEPISEGGCRHSGAVVKRLPSLETAVAGIRGAVMKRSPSLLCLHSCPSHVATITCLHRCALRFSPGFRKSC